MSEDRLYEIKDGVGIIPRDAEVIHPGAFKDCKELKSVIIPEGIRGIGDEAFMGCRNLEDVVLPSTLRFIGQMAFFESGLKTINIPEGITEFEFGTFKGCWRLKDVTFPSTLEFIQRDAFRECRFNKIIIPASIKLISSEAFYDAYINEIMFLTKDPYTIKCDPNITSRGSRDYDSGSAVRHFIGPGKSDVGKIIVPSGCLPTYWDARGVMDLENYALWSKRVKDMDGVTVYQYQREKNEKEHKERKEQKAKEDKKENRITIIGFIVIAVVFLIVWLIIDKYNL